MVSPWWTVATVTLFSKCYLRSTIERKQRKEPEQDDQLEDKRSTVTDCQLASSVPDGESLGRRRLQDSSIICLDYQAPLQWFQPVSTSGHQVRAGVRATLYFYLSCSHRPPGKERWTMVHKGVQPVGHRGWGAPIFVFVCILCHGGPCFLSTTESKK